jgi:hypothetical protein
MRAAWLPRPALLRPEAGAAQGLAGSHEEREVVVT